MYIYTLCMYIVVFFRLSGFVDALGRHPRNDRDDIDDPRHGGSVLGDYKYVMTPVSTVYRSSIGT